IVHPVHKVHQILIYTGNFKRKINMSFCHKPTMRQKRRSKRRYKHKNNGKILLCGHFSRISQGIKRSRGIFCKAFLKKKRRSKRHSRCDAPFFLFYFFFAKKSKWSQ
ncbi:MAG: hypothetical protein IKC05_09255, partial [Lentisphaeria bacterium]|nr:hypothetical protein [Lentisphaeria bacterium]